jgi:hypothetical protein
MFALLLGQAAVTGCSLFYITDHLIRGPLVIYLTVWLPAIIVLLMAVKTVKSFYARNDYFSPIDKALMGVQLSTSLT